IAVVRGCRSIDHSASDCSQESLMPRTFSGFASAIAIASARRVSIDRLSGGVAIGLVCLLAVPLAAQESLVRPGEAFVTRFSGVTTTSGAAGRPINTINSAGTVGSIIDIRAPGRPPQGEHWMDEPQRMPVTAAEVGQVFGVVFDDRA